MGKFSSSWVGETVKCETHLFIEFGVVPDNGQEYATQKISDNIT